MYQGQLEIDTHAYFARQDAISDLSEKEKSVADERDRLTRLRNELNVFILPLDGYNVFADALCSLQSAYESKMQGLKDASRRFQADATYQVSYSNPCTSEKMTHLIVGGIRATTCI